LFYVADVIRQAPALQFCLQKREMVISRFVFVSDEEVSRFIEENENENTARKSAQDVALLKSFLSEKNLKEPEELSPLKLDASLKEFVISLRKHDESDYEPSSLRCLVASIERISEEEKLRLFHHQLNQICRNARGSKGKTKSQTKRCLLGHGFRKR